MLHIVTCGGHPAADLAHFVAILCARGWDVRVIATPPALRYLDLPRLTRLTGHAVHHDQADPDRTGLPPPTAVAVAPASFQTINAWAAGTGDSLALSVLHEAVGLRVPTVAVPYPTTALAHHPALLESIGRLRRWGVDVVFDPHRHPLPTPDMGNTAARLFPWSALNQKLAATWAGLRSESP